ncbi:hypothetical protein [Actinokineospora globicatena]|nr:hypothetical protein [Actinokineospora globicatena]
MGGGENTETQLQAHAVDRADDHVGFEGEPGQGPFDVSAAEEKFGAV